MKSVAVRLGDMSGIPDQVKHNPDLIRKLRH